MKKLLVLLFTFQSTNAKNLSSIDDVTQEKSNDMGRVVGGIPAGDDDFKFIVKLVKHHKVGDDEFVTYCGGSIIDNYNVLTAAHCLAKDDIDKVEIIAGQHYVDKRGLWQERSTKRTLFVRRYDEHEQNVFLPKNYDRPNSGDDIALLTLENVRPFDLKHDKTIARAFLPRNTMSTLRIDRNRCRVAGWGRNSTCGYGTEKLRMANIAWLTDAECERMLGTDYIPDKMICAGDSNWEPSGDIKDACQGDSGGPFVCWSEERNRYLQVGIVSWGYGCGIRWNPGMYTRVRSYIEWIDDHRYEPAETPEPSRRPSRRPPSKRPNRRSKPRPGDPDYDHRIRLRR